MPAILHDTLAKLLREHPELAIDVLRNRLGVDIPRGLSVQVAPVELNDRPSRPLHPDLVLTVGPRQNPVLAIIIEVQNGPMSEKRAMLPRYAAALWLRLDCPVIVLVICPDAAVAAEAAEPIPTTLATYTLTPEVLGPREIPVITDATEMKVNPLLSLMSVALYGRNRSVAQAFVEAAQTKADGDIPYYYEYGYCMSSSEIRNLLEEIMATTWPVYSPYAKKHYGEGREDGRAEGLAEGEAKAVLTVLEARGFAVTEAVRARVLDCTDVALLEELVRRSATVTTPEDLFGDKPE
ncbi:hypothetical protein AB0K60_35985 [Thermopolyspora sp. NPDC052614]|uniref:hypothetical protein n=1 Tax=Thermopolyspora sp. NPDC052614 TaxID=3155682 RepID=UPI003432AF07